MDAGTHRFLLFWLTGFVGGLALVFSGRPLLLFTIFAAFKIVVEAGALFSRGISTHPSTQAAAQSPAKSAAGRRLEESDGASGSGRLLSLVRPGGGV